MKLPVKPLFLFLLFCSVFTRAQQIAGGEITYVCNGSDNYTVKLVLYAKCPNPNLPGTVSLNIFSNSSGTAGTSSPLTRTGTDQIIKACASKPSFCENGTGETAEAITKRTYTGTIKLPSKRSDWVLYVQEGPRTTLSTVDRADQMNLSAAINNTGTLCNSSVTFDNNPLFFSSSKMPVIYDPVLKNPDGDILQVSLINPKNSLQTSLTYKSGFSGTNPVSGTISINPANGIINLTPSKAQETTVLAMQVRETRGGVVVGSAMREIYFQTLSEQASPPSFTGSDSIKICRGNAITANISGTSPSGSVLNVIFNNQSEWPGATINISKGPGNIQFSLSTSNTFSGVKPINLTLVDDKCAMVTKTFYARINERPVITNPVEAPVTVLCLKEFDITINASGGKPPYSYVWSTGETTQTIKVKSATNHTVTVIDANNCNSLPWVKRITSPINFAVGSVRCMDSLIRFYDVSRGQNTFPVSAANPLAETAEWKWNFGDSTEATGPSPRHKFPDTSKPYDVKLTVSDGKGCTNSITKKVKVYGRPVVEFAFSDTCQRTEQSDLKVRKVRINGGDTTLLESKILYSVDGVFRTSSTGNITSLFENRTGIHTVTAKATNEAGCVTEVSKTINVRPKPLITASPLRDRYIYKCDSPGFPDTSFLYRATPVGEALSKPFEYAVERFGMPVLENKNYTPNANINVPYTIKQNTSNNIVFKTKDSFGCTNDTALTIEDPINPDIILKKYYCFLNDTLKLTDVTFEQKAYKWGLKTSVWDMRDGKTENTLGFVNHAYTTLDEAMVRVRVTDSTGCFDQDSVQVYLSEPDSSMFKISKPLACFSDTVRIIGVKNNYINSWYYRYADTVTSIYDSPDRVVRNSDFGKSVPSDLDDIKFFNSAQYKASTVIFYNESDPSKNLVALTNPNRNIPTNVCHVQVTRPWRVLERQRFAINDTYDKCYDSIKVFSARLLDTPVLNTTIDTVSWKWSLHSPKNVKLNEILLNQNAKIEYSPASSLFTEIATLRLTDFQGNYPPYTVKSSYEYTYKLGNDSLTCRDSASIKVANEKVSFELDSVVVTCANYFLPVQYTQNRFVERITVNNTEVDERSGTVWKYGDSTFTEYPFNRKFSNPGEYILKANVKNVYGCEGTDSMKVIVKPSPVARLAVDTVCFGVSNTINGSSSEASSASSSISSYYWYYSPAIPGGEDSNIPDTTKATKITTANSFQDKFQVGTFPVGLAVRDANGCYSKSDIQYAKVNDLPGIDFNAVAKNTQDQDYLGNEPIQFIPVPTSNVTYSKWNLGDGRTLASGVNTYEIEYTYPYYTPPYPKEKNIYDVTLLVRTREGCIDSVTKKLDVNAYFELPNAFSPNADGLHDHFIGIGKGIKEIKEFKVFNRWGEVIHSVTGIPEKDALQRGYLLWDGVYNGQVQPVGAYVYYAVVKTGYGNDLIKKGNLTLLK